MHTTVEKALTMLAKLQGTSVEFQIEKYNADVLDRWERMPVKPALTEEERVARIKASQRRSLDKAKEKRAAARALRSVPSAEHLAAKEAERKDRRRAYAREYMARRRAKRRAERAFRKAYGFGALPLKSPTITEAQKRISLALARRANATSSIDDRRGKH